MTDPPLTDHPEGLGTTLVFPIGDGPWERTQALIESMTGPGRTQALIDFNAMLIEHRAALRSTPTQPDTGLLAVLENDIRELRGAEPGELARRLIARGWFRSTPTQPDTGLREAQADTVIREMHAEIDRLRATEPAPTLDADRLARAYHRVTAMADEHGDPTADPDEVCVMDARAVDAEYARLTSDPETPR